MLNTALRHSAEIQKRFFLYCKENIGLTAALDNLLTFLASRPTHHTYVGHIRLKIRSNNDHRLDSVAPFRFFHPSSPLHIISQDVGAPLGDA
ncbi:hypothetical protein T4D_5835 [Trichinella pseudospiralis]|uniref:Uncharacterized protein n=1 Tax=Trichinella pseudospiralis TaxID=6337 RepID=A0A0V1FT63_TRIPS|nr:hypothetical protein T4D_5835 [Trichinella pseudospiralis]